LQTDLNDSQLGGVAVLIYSLSVISSLKNARDGNYFLLGNSLGKFIRCQGLERFNLIEIKSVLIKQEMQMIPKYP
jgi:hypothetical protein